MTSRIRKSELEGSLALTSGADVLQLLHHSSKTGMLGLSRGIGGKKSKIYLLGGDVVHAEAGELEGLEALADVLGWDVGTFGFQPGAACGRTTITLRMPVSLMEAVRLRDENSRARSVAISNHQTVQLSDGIASGVVDASSAASRVAGRSGIGTADAPQPGKEGDQGSLHERSEGMVMGQRTSTDVLEELLKVPGIDAVVVTGRDGFVIESAGSSTRLDLDGLGAAIAHAINAVEEMGGELRIDTFQDMFIEYGRAVIVCHPVGGAIAALVSPDASKLGIVRHKAKALFDELARHF